MSNVYTNPFANVTFPDGEELPSPSAFFKDELLTGVPDELLDAGIVTIIGAFPTWLIMYWINTLEALAAWLSPPMVTATTKICNVTINI